MIKYVYRKKLVRVLVSLYDACGYRLIPASVKTITAPTKITVLILNQIGDFILATSTVKVIQQAFPDAELTVITTKVNTALADLFLPDAKVKIFNPGWQRTVRQSQPETATDRPLGQLLREAQPNLVAVFHPDLEVNKIVRANCPQAVSVGFTNAGGGFNLTHPVNFPDQGHQLYRLASLSQQVSQIYQRQLAEPQPPKITIPQALARELRDRLADSQVNPEKLVVLHPFGRYPTKNWAEAGWQQVIDWLISHDYQVVLIGSSQEKAQPFYRPAGLIDWCGQLSLAETAALLAQARLFIGIDSGPAHLAASAGTKIISIYSTVNDPAQWQPIGESPVTVFAEEPVDARHYPREARQLPAGVSSNPYTDGIDVRAVIDKISSLLSTSERP